MSGAMPPAFQYVFILWWLVEHRNNFTFTLLGNTQFVGVYNTVEI
jgi:hypothetical protein